MHAMTGPFTTPKLPQEMTCQWCGLMHGATCPRVKALEYHDNGLLKRVEFHDVPSQCRSEEK